MSEPGSDSPVLNVAVVGSGPSAFYTAEALFKSGRPVTVDMFERLPAPFGLVRYGVAPDHGKIKSATRVYEKIAKHPGFRLWANVSVGRDVSVAELRGLFDAVVFAHGAETDRTLGIPGEYLPGSHAATEFVAWYNGHPDYRDCEFDLSQESVAVIGQGNVAVDVCRILLKTVDELRETDIASYALDALAESRVRDVHMIGRRGPVQAKFSQLEVKELGALEACDPVVLPSDMELDTSSIAELEDASNKSAPRIVPILRAFSERTTFDRPRKLHFHFLESPEVILGESRVESLLLRRNALEGEPFHLRAKPTSETRELRCGLVFRSVGYHGVPMAGLPFDEKRGIVPNDSGRVLEDGVPMAGVYVAGWIKRGPTGVIGTNKPDSALTVDSLLEDFCGIAVPKNEGGRGVSALLRERAIKWIGWDDWLTLDALEVARGLEAGKPREKFTEIGEIWTALGKAADAKK